MFREAGTFQSSRARKDAWLGRQSQNQAETGRCLLTLRIMSGARQTFTWEGARKELDGLPGGQGLNIAHEAVDRHANGPLRDHLAIRWLGKNGEVEDYSYGQLQTLTNRFANALQQLGVNKGDRVYILAGRIPELYVAALGTLKHGGVFCPLFSAFGPEPIRARLTIGQAKVLITTESLYDRKVKALRAFSAVSRSCCVDREQSSAHQCAQHEGLSSTDGECRRLLHNSADGAGRCSPPAFHQRHDRNSQRRSPRPRGSHRPSHYRQACTRFSSTGHLLVHRGSRMGDGDVVRHHRSAYKRHHEHCGRSGLRRGALVRNSSIAESKRLVFRANGHSHVDEGRI